MTIWLLLALAGFVAIGIGAGYTRSQPRPGISGRWTDRAAQWVTSLAGKRLIGALVAVAGLVLVLLILVLRP